MLLINSSNAIELYALTNPLPTPTFVNDASVTITITDSAGVELTGVSWPQPLPYVAGSDGVYRDTFAKFTDLINSELYSIIYNIVGVDGLELECVKKEKAGYGDCC